jgi:hypothetical protein
MYLKECAPGYDKATCTAMFITALFTIAKFWKQSRCPTADEWIKKMWYIYRKYTIKNIYCVYIEVLFGHKEK